MVFINIKKDKQKGYIITRYIDDLDWYLLVNKDTGILLETFEKQLLNELIVIVAVIALVLLIVSSLVRQNDKKLIHLAKIDTLTGVLNRRGI